MIVNVCFMYMLFLTTCGLYSARRQLSQCCNRSDLDNLCQSLFVDGAHVEVGRAKPDTGWLSYPYTHSK